MLWVGNNGMTPNRHTCLICKDEIIIVGKNNVVWFCNYCNDPNSLTLGWISDPSFKGLKRVYRKSANMKVSAIPNLSVMRDEITDTTLEDLGF